MFGTFAMRFKTMKRLSPRLIVFDLDHTLWPFGVDNFLKADQQMPNELRFKPPFRKENNKILDNENKQMVYFPEVPKVLKSLSSDGIQLGIASRTEYPLGALSLIDLFDWNRYFKYKEIYPGTKLKHFHNFQINSQFAYKEMVFFDDEQRNIDDIEPLGVFTVLVDRETGVTDDVVNEAIHKFVCLRSV